MSNANLKVVQDAYAAFGRGDIPAVIANMTEDATIGIVGRAQDAPLFGIHKGHAGAAEFFKQLMDAHEISMFEPLRFLAAEDMVFVWGHYTWTMRKSGVSKTSEWLHAISLKNGKMATWRGHNDTAMLAEAYHAAPAKRAASS
ncbi:MAG: nuclear transport factor 2 family protein [Xanthobacteraceae bacterium]|nr:nuclear transport factor 2 family protein [Xanthobacteraceae bacterium]